MLKSLEIQGFRCFRELRVEPLTRVNLFVGLNNAGKTSLLEAAELVAIGRVEGLVRSAVRRGERVLGRSDLSEEFKEHVVDPSHLFFGHDIQVGKAFGITGFGEERHWVQCEVEHASVQETLIRTLYFQSHSTAQKREHERLTISPSGGVLPPPRRLSEPPRVNFLAADSADSASLGQLWDDLLLTPEEEEVTKSLRAIEPHLERLAFLSETRGSSSNILVKLKQFEQRLPLGTLGGGLKHLLGLVLNLLSARGGCLLVDEIDTGLHYSVMVDMWRLLIENAKRLDTQVFATTHSLDCVRALARLAKRYPENAAEVMVHRLEREASKTVVYDADEIVIAADSHIEVR
ncbi:MAG TPA: AAA family ATPase [Thermoanaerobaculia bacterium]|jgi:AAA15 family ATPase/GTPase|nr:AAA family ATPase [Thermoanaerobaculia bacterium]